MPDESDASVQGIDGHLCSETVTPAGLVLVC